MTTTLGIAGTTRSPDGLRRAGSSRRATSWAIDPPGGGAAGAGNTVTTTELARRPSRDERERDTGGAAHGAGGGTLPKTTSPLPCSGAPATGSRARHPTIRAGAGVAMELESE
jgi:hypothetical protein